MTGVQQQYARSQSRGKDHGNYSQVSKINAMLGKPTNFAIRQSIN